MEHKLIAKMQNYLAQEARAPGDDCALLPALAADSERLVTTDMIMDGVHFLTAEHPLSAIGYKAMAVNISDIAAMAGTPKEAFVSLALPKGLATEDAIDELYGGMAICTESFGVTIEGGDTNVWSGPLVIAVTLLGVAHPKGAVLRSSAKPGDRVVVTGPLGGSLHKGRHLAAIPRIKEAQQLADNYSIRGMADISDGLATDLRQIMALSGVGITLNGGAVPIHSDVPAGNERQRLQAALCDGEDFELVLCCSPADAAAMVANPHVNCYDIGECTADHSELKLDWQGELSEIMAKGYEHS